MLMKKNPMIIFNSKIFNSMNNSESIKDLSRIIKIELMKVRKMLIKEQKNIDEKFNNRYINQSVSNSYINGDLNMNITINE